MKLAISNLAWESSQEEAVFGLMKKYGYTGLEIAPTKVFPVEPYGNLAQAEKWAEDLRDLWQIEAVSLQSIWYGRKENLFASAEDYAFLLDYTGQAINFAHVVGAKNLVFGCPKNRKLPAQGNKETCNAAAEEFFHAVGEYAAEKGVTVSMEANPAIYDTNFINTTKEALKFIKKVDSAGLGLNLDVGTMLANKETVAVIADETEAISHVHISEPYLAVIEKRAMHKELAALLRSKKYEGYVSIEMGKCADLSTIERCMAYVRGVFG